MAYFFWDDGGIMAFIREFEKDFVDSFVSLFTPVERADIFRILVCKYFGGIVSVLLLTAPIKVTQVYSTATSTPNLSIIHRLGFASLILPSGPIKKLGKVMAFPWQPMLRRAPI